MWYLLGYLFWPVWYFSDVEDDYDGPRLSEDGITREFVEELIERFRDQKKIHKKYAYKVTIL